MSCLPYQRGCFHFVLLLLHLLKSGAYAWFHGELLSKRIGNGERKFVPMGNSYSPVVPALFKSGG